MNKRSAMIKQLIEESGHSYQELEKLTGIKKSTLQRYASGTTTKIPITAIEKLSKAFNVSPRIIMGWEEDEQKVKNNSRIAEIIVKLRRDEELFETVSLLCDLSQEKVTKAKQILQLL